ncbi:MAG: T9SS type A sorting domain-containing protein [Bacteroidota bacterium]
MKYYPIFLFLFSTTQIFAQASWEIEYKKADTNVFVSYPIIKCTDGGFLVEGLENYSNYDKEIIKFNSNGVIEWSKKYPGYLGQSQCDFIRQASDSGYYLTWQFDDEPPLCMLGVPKSGLIKFDKNGNGIRSKWSNRDCWKDYIETMNVDFNTDDLLVIGNAWDELNQCCREHYLAVFDSTLTLKFSLDLIAMNFSGIFCKSISFNGTTEAYLICGIAPTIDSSGAVSILKVDTTGHVLWQKFYQSNPYELLDMLQVDSSFYILEQNINLRKIDYNGNTLFFNKIDSTGNTAFIDFANSQFLALEDSVHLIIAGSNFNQSIVIETDLSGIVTRAISRNLNEPNEYQSSWVESFDSAAYFISENNSSTNGGKFHVEKEYLSNPSCGYVPLILHGATSTINDSSAFSTAISYTPNWSSGGGPQPIADTITATQICNSQCMAQYTINNSCSGNCIGEITVAPITGAAPFTFSWSTGDSSTVVDSICDANISFTMMDSVGCFSTYQVSLPQFYIYLSSTPILCNGDCNALIYLSTYNGAAPYTYQWNTGDTTRNLSNRCSGIYSVIATDSNQCFDTISYALAEPSDILFATSSIQNPSCIGCADGFISFTATGGTLPYSISWIPANGSLYSDTIHQLLEGIYTVTLTDHNGCTVSIIDTLIDSPNRVSNLNEQNGILIFPSPTNGKIKIVNLKFEIDHIEINNLLGEMKYSAVFNGGSQKPVIDIESLPSGIYFVKAFAGDKILVGNVIKE